MSSDKYQRETVLVIEDDAGIAELEQMQLERAGFTVVTAGTSEEALDQLRRHHVDLLLLDYRLPGDLDGLDVYLECKAMGFDLPVILVTGFSNEAVAIRALRRACAISLPSRPNTSTTCRKPSSASSGKFEQSVNSPNRRRA